MNPLLDRIRRRFRLSSKMGTAVTAGALIFRPLHDLLWPDL